MPLPNTQAIFRVLGDPAIFCTSGQLIKSPRQQLDLHVGVGISAAAVDHFVGIGYSFCFRMAGR